MDYTTYAQLWAEATQYADFDLYVAERGWQDWMDAYADRSASAVTDVLQRIWDMAHDGTRAMRRLLGCSQVAFAARFTIPTRTVENWESGANVPPPYVMKLLGYAVLSILD